MSRSTADRFIDLPERWTFTYRPGDTPGEPAPLKSTGKCTMPLPGYWDDHLDQLKADVPDAELRTNPDYEPIRFPMVNLAPDASLPYVVGVGQYTCQFAAPRDGRVTFECGPTFIEARLWVNGQLAHHQPHYSTGWAVPLDAYLKPGEANELCLQVSNTQPRRKGCITRGFKGYSAGVFGRPRLRVTGRARLADCYVHPTDDNQTLQWQVAIDHAGGGDAMLDWRVIDPDTNAVVQQGTQAVTAGDNRWSSPASDLTPWSDRKPKLYRIELALRVGDAESDNHQQSFGLRRIEAKGFGLQLNRKPIYLRGATEHAYFPLTCTMPLDKLTYRRQIAKLKAVGFNWLRFHTWTPPEPYLDAADELGMMIQVEPPLGADDAEWSDILKVCRRHPSVVIYCAGNEELLDEAKLDQLEHWASLRRRLAPDALFNPQEALRGIEYGWKPSDLGEDALTEPYVHNPRRLEKLKTFSDCYGQFAWGLLSYNSTAGDAKLIDERLAPYEHPSLAHELGIHGSYIDLDLEHRYAGTRIGTDMYRLIREYLREQGVEHRASDYYHNSCAWQRRLRKHAVETARRCRRVAGYDLLGGIDYHWHRTAYPCGVMNEFYELKPGETADDVRRYNAASVLLLDHDGQWSLAGGQRWQAALEVSLFEDAGLVSARVEWRLRDDAGHVHRQGGWDVADVANGQVSELGTIAFDAPQLDAPASLTLDVRLVSDTLVIDNQWPTWVYSVDVQPRAAVHFEGHLQQRWVDISGAAPSMSDDEDVVHVVPALTAEVVASLAQGARVLLLGAFPFASQVTVYQIACAGRAEGNLATCIYDHPITRRWPHAGFCDWQFQKMISRGEAVQFNDLDLPFDPIVEMVSSYKHVKKQSMLFELRVGAGRLLACSLGLMPDDPAAAHVLQTCIDYAGSEAFAPRHAMSPEAVSRMIESAGKTRTDLNDTDQGFDERAALTSW